MSVGRGTVGSVSGWITLLKLGDPSAAELLWRRYFDSLVGLARLQLGAKFQRVTDEEDVLVSVFDTLCRGAREGRFPRLMDRTDLWSLLIVLVRQKAADQKRRLLAQKRGAGRIRGESAFFANGQGGRPGSIDDLIGQEPTPEDLVGLREQLERSMNSLKDSVLRTIARRKLEGCSNSEIAAELDVSIRTIERKLHRIQETWLACAEVGI